MVSSAQGKDISNWQGVEPTSFWSGFQFGFCKATEGTTFLDSTFSGNWANIKKAGLHRGAYHFFHPALDPVAQAKFFVKTVQAQGLSPGDMLAADVEITSGNTFTRFFNKKRNNLTQQKVSLGTVNATAKAFLDEVKSLVGNKNPILVYTNVNVGSQLTSCTAYPLWIAYPSNSAPTNVSPWHKWTFWQWGQTGIDRDAFNGTETDLKNFINSYSNPGPYKHILAEDTTIAAISASRTESPNGFLATQEQYFTSADAQITALKAGSVYYTSKP